MRKASGNDLKHTVTCLAAEPLGLLMSEDVNNLDGGNFIGYIPITHFSSVLPREDWSKKKGLIITYPCFNQIFSLIIYISLINNVIMAINITKLIKIEQY